MPIMIETVYYIETRTPAYKLLKLAALPVLCVPRAGERVRLFGMPPAGDALPYRVARVEHAIGHRIGGQVVDVILTPDAAKPAEDSTTVEGILNRLHTWAQRVGKPDAALELNQDGSGKLRVGDLFDPWYFFRTVDELPEVFERLEKGEEA